MFLLLFWRPLYPAITAYLSEYGNSSKLQLVNITIQCMAEFLPCYGLFGCPQWWSIWFWYFPWLAACLQIFPVVVLLQDALRVNEQYRLPAPRWCFAGTCCQVIIPVGDDHVRHLTGNEHAAGASPDCPAALFLPMSEAYWLVMALPYHLYILFSQHISMESLRHSSLLVLLLCF